MGLVAPDLLRALTVTLLDAAPVALVIGFFQAFALRRRPPQLPRILIGAAYVVLGLSLFRLGLVWSLLPIGADLSERLTARRPGVVFFGSTFSRRRSASRR